LDKYRDLLPDKWNQGWWKDIRPDFISEKENRGDAYPENLPTFLKNVTAFRSKRPVVFLKRRGLS
jgi:hypothetical protein